MDFRFNSYLCHSYDILRSLDDLLQAKNDTLNGQRLYNNEKRIFDRVLRGVIVRFKISGFRVLAFILKANYPTHRVHFFALFSILMVFDT